MNIKKKKGFTLVELLVVIAIIAVLAAVVAPNAFQAIEKSKVSAVISDYKAIKIATLNYYSDTGLWPVNAISNTHAGVVFVTGGDNAPFPTVATPKEPSGWNGPYIERWPSKNPWGGSYTFISSTAADGAIDNTGIDNSSTIKYLKVTNVSPEGVKMLEAQLDRGAVDTDAGIVRFGSTDNALPTSASDVYLVISEQ